LTASSGSWNGFGNIGRGRAGGGADMTKYGRDIGVHSKVSLVTSTETGTSMIPKTSIDPMTGTGIRKLKSKDSLEFLVKTNLRILWWMSGLSGISFPKMQRFKKNKTNIICIILYVKK